MGRGQPGKSGREQKRKRLRERRRKLPKIIPAAGRIVNEEQNFRRFWRFDALKI